MMSTFTKADWLRCDRCENPMPPELWNRARGKDGFIYAEEVDEADEPCFHQTDGGITLIWQGGYGMFTDTMTEEDQRELVWNLCHDCVVMLLDFFPERLRQKFVGGHPTYNDNTPLEDRCCRYAWDFSDEEEK